MSTLEHTKRTDRIKLDKTRNSLENSLVSRDLTELIYTKSDEDLLIHMAEAIPDKTIYKNPKLPPIYNSPPKHYRSNAGSSLSVLNDPQLVTFMGKSILNSESI